MTIVIMTVYLFRIIIFGIAVAVLFIRLNLFKSMNHGQLMIIGVASTPMFLSLMEYLLGLVCVGWPLWFYLFAPIVASLSWLILYPNNSKLIVSAFRQILNFLRQTKNRIGSWLLLDLLVSLSYVMITALFFSNPGYLGIVLSFLSSSLSPLNDMGKMVAVVLSVSLISTVAYIILKMIKDGTIITNFFVVLFLAILGHSIFWGMSYNDRALSDSDRSHYQLDARYFVQDRNSWEIDNYTDNKYGSSMPDDHGPLWVVYLADSQMLSDCFGMDDPIRICNFAALWTYFCFCMLLFLTASYISGTYKTGIISLYLFGIYIYDLLMIYGSRDGFRFVGLLLLFLYVSNFFIYTEKNMTRWYHFVFMAIFCYLAMNGHQGNIYILLGMFLVASVMYIYEKPGMKNLILFSGSILIGTFLGAIKTLFIYYDTGLLCSDTLLTFHDTPVIEQITKINNHNSEWVTIWETYTWPVRIVMLLGVIAFVIMIAISLLRRNKLLFFNGMLLFGMLLPMTGIMNWIGYDVSSRFAEHIRYRMYFLMIFAIMGGWILTIWKRNLIRCLSGMFIILAILIYMRVGYERDINYGRYSIMAYNNRAQNYVLLADRVAKLTDGDVFVNNEIILYYLKGNPKLLFHRYSEDLIQAKTENDITAAMDKLNVGAILLPESGLDYHDFSLLPLWKYLNENDSISRVKDERSGYVIFCRK